MARVFIHQREEVPEKPPPWWAVCLFVIVMLLAGRGCASMSKGEESIPVVSAK